MAANGEGCWNWKGDNVGYFALHSWIRHHFKKPSQCEECGRENVPLDWANVSGQYKRERSDFKALCRSCHWKKDFRKECCPSGHPYDEENTYYNPAGHRACRKCRRLWEKNHPRIWAERKLTLTRYLLKKENANG